MAVADYEIEEAVLEEFIFDAAENGCRIAFANFRHDDADGVGAFLAKAAGHGVGHVTVEGGSMKNAALSLFSNAVRSCFAIDDAGDGGLGELEHCCEFFQRYRFDGCLCQNL